MGPNCTTSSSAIAVYASKESGTAYLFAILLGGFAVPRFYLNSPGSAIGFIILWWGGWALSGLLIGIPMLIAAGIWWIVDMVRISEMVRTANTIRSQLGRAPGQR